MCVRAPVLCVPAALVLWRLVCECVRACSMGSSSTCSLETGVCTSARSLLYALQQRLFSGVLMRTRGWESGMACVCRACVFKCVNTHTHTHTHLNVRVHMCATVCFTCVRVFKCVRVFRCLRVPEPVHAVVCRAACAVRVRRCARECACVRASANGREREGGRRMWVREAGRQGERECRCVGIKEREFLSCIWKDSKTVSVRETEGRRDSERVSE